MSNRIKKILGYILIAFPILTLISISACYRFEATMIGLAFVAAAIGCILLGMHLIAPKNEEKDVLEQSIIDDGL